jgi:hypothetical protein
VHRDNDVRDQEGRNRLTATKSFWKRASRGGAEAQNTYRRRSRPRPGRALDKRFGRRSCGLGRHRGSSGTAPDLEPLQPASPSISCQDSDAPKALASPPGFDDWWTAMLVPDRGHHPWKTAQPVRQEFPLCLIVRIDEQWPDEHPMTYLDENRIILPVGGPGCRCGKSPSSERTPRGVGLSPAD